MVTDGVHSAAESISYRPWGWSPAQASGLQSTEAVSSAAVQQELWAGVLAMAHSGPAHPGVETGDLLVENAAPVDACLSPQGSAQLVSPAR